MKIAVIGLGFVGCVTAAVLADQGNEVIGLDIDSQKIKLLNSGKSPIFEPGLEELIKKNEKNLKFTTDYSLLSDSDVIFIAVPTPNENGKIDLNYVYSAIKSVALINKNAIIVIKSTVIPGTGTRMEKEFNVKVVSNPEFLREGNAIYDTMHPDRVVIGGNYEYTNIVSDIWKFTNAPVLLTTRENAELIKYSSNAFLATKISFINEIANLCEKIPNADVEIVAKGMGLDKRIGPLFLKAGIGYGGSCFPKDTQALITFAEDLGEKMNIVKAAKKVNEERIERIIKILERKFKKIKGLKILQLGISFKENTNDIRESQALKLYETLKKKGAIVNVFDPVNRIDTIDYCNSIEECINNADVIIVATEWQEFKILETMNIKVLVIDGRRILNPDKFENYIGIGRYYE
ncbi:MAG: UDP-glucose dehydrogenase family protein [Thermoplasmata archaeon]